MCVCISMYKVYTYKHTFKNIYRMQIKLNSYRAINNNLACKQ